MTANTYKLGCDKVVDFYCEKCNFKCSKKWMFDRHIMTSKHKNTYTDLQLSCKKSYKCECGKEYTHRQSLNNHKSKCKCIPETSQNQSIDMTDSNLIVELLKQNQDFKELLIEQNNKLIEKTTENNAKC